MSFCLIILAGGNSHRFKSNVGKPYQKIAGKSLIEINIIKALQFKQIKKIILVFNKKDSKLVKNLKLKNIQLVVGGINRQQSTFFALKYLSKQKNISKVLEDVISQKHFKVGIDNLRVQEAWVKTMGENIQKYTYGVKFKRGILYIKLKSSVLKEELIFEKNKVIKLINKELGKEYVKDLVLN